MILDDQVADGFPVIVEEAPGDPGVERRGIEQRGQIRDGVVAVPRAKGVDEIVRPIDRLADLVAVEHEGLQRVEALARAQDPVEDMGHVDRGGLAAQVVDDQAVGVRARAFEGLPRVAGDEAHDPRRPGRGVPFQAALGVHALRDVDRGAARRNGQHRDVLPMGGHAVRERDRRPDAARALDLDLTAEQLPAGVLGLDPRSPRVPAARGEQAELQAEAARLVDGVRNAGHRFRAEEGGPGRDDLPRIAEAADVPNDGPSEPFGLQLLKLAGQLIPVDEAVEPGPEDARPGREGGIKEVLLGERGPVRCRPGSGRGPRPAGTEDQEDRAEECGMDLPRRPHRFSVRTEHGCWRAMQQAFIPNRAPSPMIHSSAI